MSFSIRRTLSFSYLYGDRYGHVEGKRSKWAYRKIVFPEGFVPDAGKSYECDVTETLSGTFSWGGETFTVCRASLADTVDWSGVTEQVNRSNNTPKKTAMQLALEQAGLALVQK